MKIRFCILWDIILIQQFHTVHLSDFLYITYWCSRPVSYFSFMELRMGKASIWVRSQAFHLAILVCMHIFFNLLWHTILFVYLVLRVFEPTAPLCTEMGRGRHQIPSKEELMKKYNQINKINQVNDIHCHLLRCTWQGLLFLSFSSIPCFRSQSKPGFCITGA